MNKSRFKQLLESTLGNVKPLIYEDVTTLTTTINGDYKSTGGDVEKYNRMVDKVSELAASLKQNYPDNSDIKNQTKFEYTKPNVFTMSIELDIPQKINFKTNSKEVWKEIKKITNKDPHIRFIDVNSFFNSENKNPKNQEYTLTYVLLSTDKFPYPEKNEKTFDAFHDWLINSLRSYINGYIADLNTIENTIENTDVAKN